MLGGSMDKFLIYNGAGWCNVHIGNFDSRASYLTDVPIEEEDV